MKKISLLLCLFFLTATVCPAVDSFEAYCHWIEPKTKVTISWNPVEGADGYQLEVIKIETNKTILSTHVLAPTYKITFNSNGHYVLRERSFTSNAGIKSYGEWQMSNNIDDGLVLVGQTLTPKPWIVIVPVR
jgi:hypothetical protein